MDEQKFWELVESSKASAEGSFDDHEEELAALLSQLPPDDILSFERIFLEKTIRAYSWDLWGAAYVINGGCSDDGFTDFRSWLISLGRERYERALRDPESLAEVKLGPDGEEDASFEGFAYVAATVYEKVTGKKIPDTGVAYPREPSGEPWEEDDAALAERYPVLSAKYGNR